MSEELTAAQLVAPRRFIVLRDGIPRELDYDFSALACYETAFMMPEMERFEALQAQYPKGVPIAELQKLRPKTGMVLNSGRWAYCLTAAWREDNGEAEMTWREFKRLLPGPKHPEACEAWQTAVQAMLHTEQGPALGNEGGGAEEKTTSSIASPSESLGSDSTTPEP